VEEKSEQLKTVCNLAALIAGFAVVAMIEFQFQSTPEILPEQNLLVIGAYASATALTVRRTLRWPFLPPRPLFLGSHAVTGKLTPPVGRRAVRADDERHGAVRVDAGCHPQER